jgi:N6-L-threonylcarbamoyladenine synthase
MRILAIETSCDDTCIGIIEVFSKEKPQFKILSNIVSSQVEIHKKWGGVFPALAKREHQNNLVVVLKEALKKAKLLKKSKNPLKINKDKELRKLLEREEDLSQKLIKFLKNYEKPDIDLIAVTVGPGLEPCLWVGVNFAKALAYYWNLSIIPVNHIEAHIFANLIGLKSKIPARIAKRSVVGGQNPKFKTLFPAICLVASGGHTQLILMRKIGFYKVLGETRDDAAGECFDKVARILGLGYPGGLVISQLGAKLKSNVKYQKSKIILPRPMINQKNYDFSFSGLKTAVLYNFKIQSKKTQKSKRYIKEICKETQQAIIDVLVSKTLRAAIEFKAKTVFLGGGVTANKELRRQLKAEIIKKIPNTEYFIPDTKYCTDNAVMVGLVAYFNHSKTKGWKEIEANANQRI